MISVSTWLYHQLLRPGLPPVARRCRYTGSDGIAHDLTPFVDRWPTSVPLKEGLSPGQVSVTLNRMTPRSSTGLYSGEYYNSFSFSDSAGTVAYSPWGRLSLELGFTHPVSGTEWLPCFAGMIERKEFSRGQVTLQARSSRYRMDYRPLTFDVGSNSSNQYADWSTPPLCAWAVCNSAGLDTVNSTSNRDINWDSWLSWVTTFSHDAQWACASFKGQKATAALEEIAKHTGSLIASDAQGRLRFVRRSGPLGANDPLVDYSVLSDIEYYAERRSNPPNVGMTWGWSDLLNDYRGTVLSYRYFYEQIIGYVEESLSSTMFWFMAESGCQYNVGKIWQAWWTGAEDGPFMRPFMRGKFSLPAFGAILEPGDILRVVDSWMGLDSGWAANSMGLFLTGRTLNMQTLETTFDFEERRPDLW